ncbi:MAG: hypothetical protein ACD_11C00004G0019 [uncultured bacterium]|nr:MAG: hypothetical protein ACD_11C00004G0019 [uncultured bacterium]HBR71653.1 hypothetical protein [Candidatus Moranbacteria bacterium]
MLNNKKNKKLITGSILRVVRHGFSIGEVLLSMLILSFVMVLMTNLLVKSILHSTDSRDRIIASQLAQEGVELVRNVRDNNWADGDPTTESFECNDNFPNTDNTQCRIDINSIDVNGINDCDNDPSANFYDLNIDSNNGFYSHSNGEETKFQRKIEVDYTPGACPASSYVTITSMVVWGNNSPDDIANVTDCNMENKCAYAQSILTKWGEQQYAEK